MPNTVLAPSFVRGYDSAQRWRAGAAWVLAALVWWTGTCQADSGLEAKVKAAYLYNFTKFVEWPNSTAENFTVCVTGSASVVDWLTELSARQAKGRPLKVEAGVPGEPGRCQIWFIGQEERRAAELAGRAKAGVLTVGDAPDFARQGGVIGFYTDGGKLRLEINPERARGAGLKISAKLMEIARIVP